MVSRNPGTSAPAPLARPTSQARSRRTVDRLLNAAETLLEEGGLDAAIVPAIARRARMSVGIVYRRFPDKDALLRGVYERLFERNRESNRLVLDPARWQGVPLAEMVQLLVAGMVQGYETRKRLLRALLLYGETHADSAFRRRAHELSGEAFAGIGELLLAHRGQIHHPDPPAAIALVLMVLALAIRGIVLPERTQRLAPIASGERLCPELARLVLRYLGVAGPNDD